MGIYTKIKNKLIDKASDVLSMPAKLKAKKVMKQADIDTAALKEVRQYDKGMVFEPGSRHSQVKWLADDARFRRDPSYRAKMEAKLKNR